MSTTPLPRAPDAIILFAHGSREPLWRAPIEAVAARIRQTWPAHACATHPSALVACAYLELCDPSLLSATDAIATQLIALDAYSVRANPSNCLKNTLFKPTIRIIPMFLGMGRHIRTDLPEHIAELRARHPHINIEVAAPIGEDERVITLLAQVASEPLEQACRP